MKFNLCTDISSVFLVFNGESVKFSIFITKIKDILNLCKTQGRQEYKYYHITCSNRSLLLIFINLKNQIEKWKVVAIRICTNLSLRS